MARHSGPSTTPWYRSPAATFTAGGVGAVLIGALAVTVVQMSDQWSTPTDTVITSPGPTPAAPTSSREKLPFVVTPSETSTSFTTSVPVSTTDIGIPPAVPSDTTSSESTSSGTTSPETTPGTSSPSESTVPATTTDAEAGTDDDEPTTTRKRPRYNETRTYTPSQ